MYIYNFKFYSKNKKICSNNNIIMLTIPFDILKRKYFCHDRGGISKCYLRLLNVLKKIVVGYQSDTHCFH